MFVFYLDQCNTALWKAFFLGSWVVAMIFCYWTALRLLSIPGDRRALRQTGLAGQAFERQKPKVSRRALLFLASLAAKNPAKMDTRAATMMMPIWWWYM